MHRQSLEELASDGGKGELQEILMGVLEVTHQRRHIHLERLPVAPCAEIGDGEECVAVDAALAADLLDRGVAEAESHVETAYHHQQLRLVMDKLPHHVARAERIIPLCFHCPYFWPPSIISV